MKTPVIDKEAKIAPNAIIVGDVHIGKNSSVFYNAVLRADRGTIIIGENTNIQDGTIIHEEPEFPCTIGNYVTVGHMAMLHGCTIGDNTVVGMGSIIMDGAVIGKNCIIGAGALIPGGKEIPDGSVVMGAPGKIRREVTEEDIVANHHNATHYVEVSQELF